MRHLSFTDYGLIGNQNGTALISRFGSVDWCCIPYLDSGSFLGNFRSDSRGLGIVLRPEGEYRCQQHYVDQSLVLETRFETPYGHALLEDWLSPGEGILERRLTTTDGTIPWLWSCTPRFAGGRPANSAEAHHRGVLFRGQARGELALLSLRKFAGPDAPPLTLPLKMGSSAVNGAFDLGAGERLELRWAVGRAAIECLLGDSRQDRSQERTLHHWKSRAHACSGTGCPFAGPWHDVFARSTLVLQSLLVPFSGALGEAALPLRRAGQCYAWVRDVAPALAVLANLGRLDEARALFNWLSTVILRDGAEALQPAYTLDGGRFFPELLDKDEPENQRAMQALHEFQLDTYGHVFLASVEAFRLFGALPQPLWERLVEVADHVCRAWRRPDHGAWHARRASGPLGGKPEHFVGSKLFCWVALDRACWLAAAHGLPVPTRWQEERRILHRTICEQGYDPGRESFVRTFADRELDPSALFLPLVGFIPPDDPRVISTLETIGAQLSEGVLIHNYRDPHSLEPSDGASLFYSFLYASCLALCGRAEEASDHIAELCTYATPLGLLGDHVDPSTGETVGAFPCAEAHLAMMQSVLLLAATKGKALPHPLFTTLPAPPAPAKTA